MSTNPAFEMRNISKRFPGVLANDNVSFAAAKGEIHALLGENGAGKSTLMSVLCGLYRPDGGELLIDGAPVDFRSPRDAIRAGVGMVYQHFMLAPSQTVTENVMLGLRDTPFVLNTPQLAAEVEKIGAQFHLPVDPHAMIWQLSVGEQQRVEIIKMLYRGANILILDEPTAVLTPPEIEGFFRTLREMAAAGKTIVFISHKLDEVLSIADRITILRGGKWVDTVANANLTKATLASMMVGREVLFRLDKTPHQPGAAQLALSQVQALDDKRLPALRKLSLTVHAGEIVGVAGVAGNGQRELAEVIAGIRPVTGGAIAVTGQDVTHAPPLARIQAGVAYVPEDRSATGSAPDLSVAENLALRAFRKAPLAGRFVLKRQLMQQQAQKLIAQFGIATPSPQTPSRKLSGGNLQKLILAREISSQPQVLVAAYPTRGLDIGATEYVRKVLLEEREKGVAILLLSEDLEEIFALADRIAVIFEGQIVGDLPAKTADLETVGLLMAGEQVEA
ncbi:MAG: ABC transporter ATP-binding protein [Caldilineaceae bacterium]|nr:ABC transporter ATP-binding protein [Caldilineaceae bacterium]